MKECRLQPKTTLTEDTEIKEKATYPSNGSMKLTSEANNDKEGEIKFVSLLQNSYYHGYFSTQDTFILTQRIL